MFLKKIYIYIFYKYLVTVITRYLVSSLMEKKWERHVGCHSHVNKEKVKAFQSSHNCHQTFVLKISQKEFLVIMERKGKLKLFKVH